MTDARCVPPDGAEDGSLHMLIAPDGEIDCGKWRGPRMGWWFGNYMSMTPQHGAESGWRYLRPIPSAPELARLREIEEAAREVRKTLADVLDYLNDLEEAIQLEIRVDDARDRLTAALAKEPT